MSQIQTIYKARKTILQQLASQNYDVSEYSQFSVNEIDAMLANNQLDMLVSDVDTQRKAYVKFHIDAKQFRPQVLDEVIEDLFLIETVLTKNDTLIAIVDTDPNDTMVEKLKYLFAHSGIFVVFHNIRRLQFNVLEHRLVPPVRVLSDIETTELLVSYNLKTTEQLPEISRFDPQALAILLRPGQVCAIERDSATALKTMYYRACK
jgi:DNA-directed RNA polymerase subunit H (RpoH/RPB5)